MGISDRLKAFFGIATGPTARPDPQMILRGLPPLGRTPGAEMILVIQVLVTAVNGATTEATVLDIGAAPQAAILWSEKGTVRHNEG